MMIMPSGGAQVDAIRHTVRLLAALHSEVRAAPKPPSSHSNDRLTAFIPLPHTPLAVAIGLRRTMTFTIDHAVWFGGIQRTSALDQFICHAGGIGCFL